MLPNYFVPQPTNALIWVQGIEAAKSYMVAPNNTVTLWDAENPVIYLKSADAVGMPSMKIIDYTFRDLPEKTLKGLTSEYVTKDDLLAIQKEMEQIKAKLEPKKSTRKEAVSDD